MSQQQLTESQLPITHGVLIGTETNFRNELTPNKSTEETKQIEIIKIIPHSRDKFSSQLKFWQRHIEVALPIY